MSARYAAFQQDGWERTDWVVEDLTRPVCGGLSEQDKQRVPPVSEVVCLCFDEADARLIAAALNEYVTNREDDARYLTEEGGS